MWDGNAKLICSTISVVLLPFHADFNKHVMHLCAKVPESHFFDFRLVNSSLYDLQATN